MNDHIIRASDSSRFDEICVNCGAVDVELNGGCESPGSPYPTRQDYDRANDEASQRYIANH